MKDDSIQSVIKDLKNYIALEKESGMNEVMLASIVKNKDSKCTRI